MLNKFQSKQGGFTLIELVVAIGIMLILGAAVTPMLLSHLEDAKVANMNETLLNTKTAFDSYFVDSQGVLQDDDGDGYFDDLVDAGYMSRIPNDKNFDFQIGEFSNTTSQAYFVTMNSTTAAGQDVVQKLDGQLGDEGAAQGALQYETDGNQTDAVYLLHGDVSVKSTDWNGLN